jgi:SPP1 family predicted phage head-tail adaptor
MRTGELDQLISFETGTETTDDLGSRSTSWDEVHKAWAKIVPLSASEQVENLQEKATALYRITVRTSFTIDATMRIKWGAVYLNIRQAPLPGRYPYTTIVAEQNVPS